jgi:transcriptional regulator with XRE-family HTH domain
MVTDVEPRRVGPILRALRLAAGINADTLARRINMSRSGVYRRESGQVHIPTAELITHLEALTHPKDRHA